MRSFYPSGDSFAEMKALIACKIRERKVEGDTERERVITEYVNGYIHGPYIDVSYRPLLAVGVYG